MAAFSARIAQQSMCRNTRNRTLSGSMVGEASIGGWYSDCTFRRPPVRFGIHFFSIPTGANNVRFTFTLAIFALVLLAVPALQSPSQETRSHDQEMQKKLDYSKQILDGLVTEDFGKILKGAKSLNEFGKRKWAENDSVAYRTQNQVFWFTTGTLVAAAEEKNIDSATLSYTQMTHSCVNCHKLLRRQ